MKTNIMQKALTAAAFLLLAGLSSCNKEAASVLQPEDANTDPVSSELGGITFHFNFGGQETQVLPRAIHDTPEWTINKLWMYEFSKDGEALLKDPVDISQYFLPSGSDAKYTYKLYVNEEDDGVRQFFFVSNIDKVDLAIGASLQDLKKKVMLKQLSTNSNQLVTLLGTSGDYVIPMTGQALNGTNPNVYVTQNNQIDVKMTRVVARIDIYNYHPDLTITEIKLNNAATKSYLYNPAADTESFSIPSNDVANGVSMFASLPNSFSGARDGSKFIKKAFYLYEKINTSLSTTNLIIKGKFKGQDIEYTVPFVRNDTGTVEYVDIRRNHIYTINFGNSKTGVSFSIMDTPWSMYHFNEFFSPITVSGTGVAAKDVNKWELSVSNTGGLQTLTLGTSYTATGAYSAITSDSWITGITVSGNTLKFNVNNNSGAERTGLVTISYGTEGSVNLYVKQASL